MSLRDNAIVSIDTGNIYQWGSVMSQIADEIETIPPVITSEIIRLFKTEFYDKIDRAASADRPHYWHLYKPTASRSGSYTADDRLFYFKVDKSGQTRRDAYMSVEIDFIMNRDKYNRPSQTLEGDKRQEMLEPFYWQAPVMEFQSAREVNPIREHQFLVFWSDKRTDADGAPIEDGFVFVKGAPTFPGNKKTKGSLTATFNAWKQGAEARMTRELRTAFMQATEDRYETLMRKAVKLARGGTQISADAKLGLTRSGNKIYFTDPSVKGRQGQKGRFDVSDADAVSGEGQILAMQIIRYIERNGG